MAFITSAAFVVAVRGFSAAGEGEFDPFAALRDRGVTGAYMGDAAEARQNGMLFMKSLEEAAGTNPNDPAVPSGFGRKLTLVVSLLARLKGGG